MANFLDNLDKEKLDGMEKSLNENTQYLKDIVDKVVNSYTNDLDIIMSNIKEEVVDRATPAPIELVEKYFLELSNCLYFIGEGSEKLGIYDSISKAIAKEAFNNAYMDDKVALDEKGKKRTVAELTALSENASVYEQMVSDIYNKAYKTVKIKVSAGESMCAALNKIMSRRMSELQLSSIQPSTFTERKILNEGEVF